MRLSNEALAELRSSAKDLRMHARYLDGLARADREGGNSAGERMWRLEAKMLRRNAKRHDEAITDERLERRIDQIRARHQSSCAPVALVNGGAR